VSYYQCGRLPSSCNQLFKLPGVRTHLIYQYYILYLARWWFKETETCRRIFNINYQYILLCYWLNKWLYYCKTQWDGFYQNSVCILSLACYSWRLKYSPKLWHLTTETLGVATQNRAIFMNLSGSGKCPGTGCYEYGNEISAFVDGDKFIYQRHDCRLCTMEMFRGDSCEYINLYSVEKLLVPVRRCLSLSKHVNQTARLSHTAPNNLWKRNVYIAS
jgi:hypothetical protein